ncbi:peroxidase family protein [Octadecabacter dasysiphoniae]|uniref:peroxidase family protein n=1 Tax=Octadecabacter dasysiphoniae TaxID=2909341 RepID=UPI00300CF86C
MTSSCPFLAKIEAQERLVEARYEDGISETFSGGADPVTVSMVVFDQDGDNPNAAGLSTLFTTFGQFLDHDMVLSPEDHDAGTLDLVGMPHDIARSQVAEEIEDGETIAPTNVVTWQIDGSQVYGSTDARMDDLRSFEGGKLRMQDDTTSAADMLPDADADSFMAGDIEGDDPVYLAGDVRANENPNLLSLHTTFVREHNHWAEKLAEDHPDWDDEQLYDAARSIVEYELQSITYNEWLPHLVGGAVDDTDVEPDASGEVSVEFSTAAFRFGHTLVSSNIDMMNDDGTDAGSMDLMDAFFNHSPVEESGIEAILRGQLSATAQELDTEIVDDLNFFLETPDGVSGFSLAALNLARGLDHGLESYIETRAQLIGDIDPATLAPLDFSIITSDLDVQARLAAAYTDVFQVDLWVGGLAEDSIDDTKLGPLFTYIVADQFARTRAADDTFGDLDPALGADIIAQVQASTLADIIERNSDVDMVQDDVFLAADRSQSDIDDVETTWFDDTIDLAAKTLNSPINTGGGNDTITLSGGSTINGDVDMSKGDDTLIATSGTINGDVRMASGNDTVHLSGTADLNGDLRASLGDDTLVVTDMAAVGGNIMMGDGNDSVTLDGRATVSGELCTGDGEDEITLAGRTSVFGSVNAGKGDDKIIVENGAELDDLFGGKGFDTLQLDANARVELEANGVDGQVFYLDDNGNDTDDGFAFKSIERITCFTLGTLIITERGKIPIEDLAIGDRVWTMDAGLQPIAWIGRATVPAQGDLAPILIRKGAMDNTRDLLVSPQHRMMLDGWRVEMHCGTDEVLAPAKALTNDASIRRIEGGDVTYIHIAFDTHQIVIAEGIPSESFFPGAEALSALDQAARDEILALFPQWRCPHLRPQAARHIVTAREAKALT